MRSTGIWTAVLMAAAATVLAVQDAEIAALRKVTAEAGLKDLIAALDAPPVLATGVRHAPNGIGLPVADFLPVPSAAMTTQARDAAGVFTLKTGAWRLDGESYSLRPGGAAHADGEGYVAAPFVGPGAQLVQAVLSRAYQQPDVSQRDVQMLLWAIVSRAPITGSPAAGVAGALLTPAQIAFLDKARLPVLGGRSRALVDEHLSDPFARLLLAESDIRSLMGASATIDALRKAAVFDGEPESVLGDRDLLQGRWSHYQEMFVRHAPRDGRTLRTEVIVPSGTLPDLRRDSANRITQARYGTGIMIVAEYDVSREPEPSPNDPGVTANRFTRLTITGVPLVGAASGSTVVVANAGWTFVGRPAGSAAFGDDTSGAAAVFPGRQERYKAQFWWASGAKSARADAAARDRDANDDEAFRTGVAAALEEQGKLAPWIATALRLQSFEWLHCQSAANPCVTVPKGSAAPPAPTATMRFDPTAVVAVPGNVGRQSLATSGRAVR